MKILMPKNKTILIVKAETHTEQEELDDIKALVQEMINNGKRDNTQTKPPDTAASFSAP